MTLSDWQEQNSCCTKCNFVFADKQDALLPRMFCSTSLDIHGYKSLYQWVVFFSVHFHSTHKITFIIMNIQFLYENGKGSVVDEYGRPEPMDCIVDKEQFYLEALGSHA